MNKFEEFTKNNVKENDSLRPFPYKRLTQLTGLPRTTLRRNRVNEPSSMMHTICDLLETIIQDDQEKMEEIRKIALEKNY